MRLNIWIQLIYSLIISCIISSGCGDTTMKPSDISLQSASITHNAWDELSKKKIYFGHMSVGYDIIAGINYIKKINPSIKLNIQETKNPELIKNGIFAHSANGENTRPKSKIDSFVKTMEAGLGQKVDIAFFKFCYVDFEENTDVNDLFGYYSSSMDLLKKMYPKVTFIHATAPLTAEGESVNVKYYVKYLVKKVLGKAKNSYINIKRNEFNSLLRKKYDSRHIIDIELFESTKPDGTRYISNDGGKKHNSLVPVYTYDGGHLNETGRVQVADKLLVAIVNLLQ
jgi:hypothetical protein